MGYSSILTGLLPFGDHGFSWNGISEAQGLHWAKGSAPDHPECAIFNKLGLHSASCQIPSNFMCEAKSSDQLTTENDHDHEITSPKESDATNEQTTTAETTQAESTTSTRKKTYTANIFMAQF